MFESENDIERALVDSAKDNSRVPAFLRQLLDTEILVAYSCNCEIKPDADGRATIPPGALLTERGVTDNGKPLHTFFTAPSRARAVFADDHVIMPHKLRNLFARHPNACFVLNPGSDLAHQFLPEEVQRLLAGDFSPPVSTLKITEPTNIRVGQPPHYPTDLVDTLSKVFANHPVIRAAYLAQVEFPR